MQADLGKLAAATDEASWVVQATQWPLLLFRPGDVRDEFVRADVSVVCSAYLSVSIPAGGEDVAHEEDSAHNSASGVFPCIWDDCEKEFSSHKAMMTHYRFVHDVCHIVSNLVITTSAHGVCRFSLPELLHNAMQFVCAMRGAALVEMTWCIGVTRFCVHTAWYAQSARLNVISLSIRKYTPVAIIEAQLLSQSHPWSSTLVPVMPPARVEGKGRGAGAAPMSVDSGAESGAIVPTTAAVNSWLLGADDPARPAKTARGEGGKESGREASQSNPFVPQGSSSPSAQTKSEWTIGARAIGSRRRASSPRSSSARRSTTPSRSAGSKVL